MDAGRACWTDDGNGTVHYVELTVMLLSGQTVAHCVAEDSLSVEHLKIHVEESANEPGTVVSQLIWGDMLLQGMVTLKDLGMSGHEQLVAICTFVLEGQFESYDVTNTCECCFHGRERQLLFRADGTGTYWQATVYEYEDDVDFTADQGHTFCYSVGTLQEGVSGLERCVQFLWDHDSDGQHTDNITARHDPCFHAAALLIHPSDVLRNRLRIGEAVFVDTRRLAKRGRHLRDEITDLQILRSDVMYRIEMQEPLIPETDPWFEATPPWIHWLDALSLSTNRRQAAVKSHQRLQLQESREAVLRAARLRRKAVRRLAKQRSCARHWERDQRADFCL
eukprot:s772_g10.t1